MADVDNFKKIDNQYGHEAGDVVLICMSNITEEICKRHKVQLHGHCEEADRGRRRTSWN
ncbi:diguanylate cyclase [Lacrimispora sp. NSJ-141]|uniref:Diguanylate cyclase n=1 Tax=Lientehia hominis TaxID=2897778 RepID=A0AAP2W9J2_9FIRM|nr:diguanylate cyclase [Lientehia hominis]MCD2493435.1 diguanylate cyclase [Lientehia hominis]